MNLAHLRYFARLSESEHFSNTAKELYITQPSLSHAIKTLEAEIGVKLFVREGRRMRLTPFGREFAVYVKRGLREIDKGLDVAQEYNGKRGGTVNIGSVFTVQGDYLPRLFCDFKMACGQETRLNLFQGFTMPLLDGLENEVYDVVFSAKGEGMTDLCFEPVLAHQLVAVVAQGHELARKDSVTLADLAGWQVHTYVRGVPVGEEVERVLGAAGVEASYDFEDEISLGGMVRSAPGIVGVATLTIGLKMYDDLVLLPIEDVPRDFHTIYLVYRRDAFRSVAVERFIDFVQDYRPPKDAIPNMATCA